MHRIALVAFWVLCPLLARGAQPDGPPQFIERVLAQLPDNPRRVIPSPDGTRVAIEIATPQGEYYRLDGKDGPKYRMVGAGTFSPDGKRFAYAAAQADRPFIVVDGVAHRPYAAIVDKPGLVFTPDSKHVGYAVVEGGMAFVVIDGQEGPKRNYRNIWGPFFSPDSRRYAYTVDYAAGIDILVDEVRWINPSLRNCATDFPVFSPDSRRVAVRVSSEGRGDAVAVDDVVGPWYRSVSNLKFSPDGQHLAYLVQRHADGRAALVFDGQEGPPVTTFADPSLVFSPDSNHTAYVSVAVAGRVPSNYAVMYDDLRWKIYDEIRTPLVFSPDSKHLGYAARRGGQWFAVLDDVEGPPYENATAPTFSPDSKRRAFLIKAAGMEQVILDGQPQPRFAAVDPRALVFSPSGRHLAYIAHTGKDWVVVIDGHQSPPLSAVSTLPLRFVSEDWVHAVGERAGAVVRLEVGVGPPPGAPAPAMQR